MHVQRMLEGVGVHILAEFLSKILGKSEGKLGPYLRS